MFGTLSLWVAHNLYICMTKSYKATHFWMYRYDKRYTLFVYQIYKKVITNPPTQNQSVKISAIRGKNIVKLCVNLAQHSDTNPKTHHHTITIPSVNHPSVRVFFVQSNGTKNVSRTKQKNKLP